MPRHFTAASSDGFVSAQGTIGSTFAYGTIAIICRKASDGAFMGLIHAIDAAEDVAHDGPNIEVDASNNAYISWVENVALNAFTITVADNWVLIVAVKGSGNVTYTNYKYVFDTNTWTTGTGTANDNAKTNITHVNLGCWHPVAGDYLNGDIAAAAIWQNIALADDQIRNLPYSLGAWILHNPTAMWVLDQNSISDKILDWTGGHADQATLNGTSVSTNSAPLGYGHEVVIPNGFSAAGSSIIKSADLTAAFNFTTANVARLIRVSTAAPTYQYSSAIVKSQIITKSISLSYLYTQSLLAAIIKPRATTLAYTYASILAANRIIGKTITAVYNYASTLASVTLKASSTTPTAIYTTSLLRQLINGKNVAAVINYSSAVNIGSTVTKIFTSQLNYGLIVLGENANAGVVSTAVDTISLHQKNKLRAHFTKQTVVETTALLGAGETYTITIPESSEFLEYVGAVLGTDVAGILYIERKIFAADAWLITNTLLVTTELEITEQVMTRYTRFRYVNSSAPQTRFLFKGYIYVSRHMV